MENLEKIKKLLGFRKNPDLAIFDELNEISEQLGVVSEVFNGKSLGELGALKGEKGDTPVLGVDYTIPDPIPGPPGKPGKEGKTPVKGIDYNDGEDGYTPIKGVDYFDGEKGEKGDKGDKGDNGSPDTAAQIIDKLESVENEDDKLDASAIRNLPEPEYNPVTKKYFFGGGGGRWIIGQSATPGGTLTVSATAPSNPAVSDLWVDIS
jgi:hypothetical protein